MRDTVSAARRYCPEKSDESTPKIFIALTSNKPRLPGRVWQFDLATFARRRINACVLIKSEDDKSVKFSLPALNKPPGFRQLNF